MVNAGRQIGATQRKGSHIINDKQVQNGVIDLGTLERSLCHAVTQDRPKCLYCRLMSVASRMLVKGRNLFDETYDEASGGQNKRHTRVSLIILAPGCK